MAGADADEVARRMAKIQEDALRRVGLREDPTVDVQRSMRIAAHVVYLLYLVPAWPMLGGAILAHALSASQRDTWLGSHFRWLVVTFWVALIASMAILGLAALLSSAGFLAMALELDARNLLGDRLLQPVVIAMALLLAWYLYRVGKGWWLLCLRREVA